LGIRTDDEDMERRSKIPFLGNASAEHFNLAEGSGQSGTRPRVLKAIQMGKQNVALK